MDTLLAELVLQLSLDDRASVHSIRRGMRGEGLRGGIVGVGHEWRELNALPLRTAFQATALVNACPMREEDCAALARRLRTTLALRSDGACIAEFAKATLWKRVQQERGKGGRATESVHPDLADEFRRFEEQFVFVPPSPSSQYCRTHAIRISPHGRILEGPFLDQSNRVIRNWAQLEHHFLNVAFVGFDGSQIGQWMFTRPEYRNAGFEGTITNTFREGVRVAGRLYKFLAFSNSSLKEGRFLFFHEPTDGSATVESIRIWMGDFSHIRCPARYAARMAQALSSTIPTIDMEGNQVAMHCPDVKRNGYTFSDGVGTVSPDLADAIWDSLRAGRTHVAVHQTKEREAATPSAFQIRFGGAKGMISVDLNLHGRRMRLRKSMIKFEAPNCTILEIAGHALSWRNAYLNRQIILILEDLGVPAKVFLDIQRDCIRELQLMQTDQHKVLDMAGNIGHFGNFVRMIATVGVVNWMQNEFIQASLDHVRLYFLKEIKYRARMKIPDGAWTLFGVLDETGTLKEGEVFVQLFDPDSPSDNKILKGPVMVFRSPCLHPGDCQPATAVEVPALHHLRNVVVFSQNGQRDLPSMLAGGDLDGDTFSIVMNRNLFPSLDNFHEAAEYAPSQDRTLLRPVTIHDVQDFIVEYLKKNNLGLIAKRHLAFADRTLGGTRHPISLLLAEKHSTAVDFAKTGVAASMDDVPTVCPKPDFMRRPNERFSSRQFYSSQRVQGLLFRDPTLNALLRDTHSHPAAPGYPNPARDPLWLHAKNRAGKTWNRLQDESRVFLASYRFQVHEIAAHCDPPLSEMDLWTGCIDMSNRAYHRSSFNFEAWAKDQFGALLVRLHRLMVEGRDEEEVKDLAASNYHVAFFGREDPEGMEVGRVFGMLLLHYLFE